MARIIVNGSYKRLFGKTAGLYLFWILLMGDSVVDDYVMAATFVSFIIGRL